jgi:hydrogenase maturation protease
MTAGRDRARLSGLPEQSQDGLQRPGREPRSDATGDEAWDHGLLPGLIPGRYVVIGIGNEFRGDDGVGLAVAQRLHDLVPDGVTIVPCEQEPSRLIDAWEGAGTAMIVDAVQSGAKPGTLHRFDASDAPLSAEVLHSSTHAFGVGEAIELARALGKLPPRVLVYGVEGTEFGAVDGLTEPVGAAVELAVDAVLEDLHRLTGQEGQCTSER